MTDHNNKNRVHAPRKELFDLDIERQSPPIPYRPSPITWEDRNDSTGLPIPPPPAAASIVPTTPVVSRPTLNQVPPPGNITPPRSRNPSKALSPKTPDTFFSREDDEEAFSSEDNVVKGEVNHTSKSKHDDEQDSSGASSRTSHSTAVEQNPWEDGKDKSWSISTTKLFMIACLMLLLVLIAVLATVYFALFGKGSDDVVVPVSQFTDWSTLKPTVTATPFETRAPVLPPSDRPDLTLTPTLSPTTGGVVFGTPSPSSMDQTTTTTQIPTRSAVTTPGPSTNRPTQRPTPGPTQRPTTPPPTRTIAPGNSVFADTIANFIYQDNSVDRADPAAQKAVRWLANEATAAESIVFPFDEKYKQRFGILALYFSVDPNVQPSNLDNARLPNVRMQNQDECSWRGMSCDTNGLITKIALSKRELDGTLPAKWKFFPNLRSVDFSNNELKGSIPEELYDISGLEQVYLYKNQLGGTISSRLGRLWKLTHFLVSHNNIGGSIPPEIASDGTNRVRQLQYFNVHRNQMTGSIPSISMHLRQLLLLDLGRNQFSGTVPPNFGTESVRLRNLYLDHNQFSGTFPSEVLNAGDGRLDELYLDNNQFTGTFPGDHKSGNAMMAMTIQNNNFVSMERNATCSLDVFSGGELVEFKSDCLVCRCGFALMCRYCSL